MSPPPNQPDDLRAIIVRVEALERWMRDGDARERRLMSEVQGEYASLVDALKRHTDASNQAQLQPVLMRLTQLEASIARMLASDAEDRAIKESMRVALSEHAAAMRVEAAMRQESRAQLEALELARVHKAEQRKTVLTVIGSIVVALLGLAGAAVASWSGHK